MGECLQQIINVVDLKPNIIWYTGIIKNNISDILSIIAILEKYSAILPAGKYYYVYDSDVYSEYIFIGADAICPDLVDKMLRVFTEYTEFPIDNFLTIDDSLCRLSYEDMVKVLDGINKVKCVEVAIGDVIYIMSGPCKDLTAKVVGVNGTRLDINIDLDDGFNLLRSIDLDEVEIDVLH